MTDITLRPCWKSRLLDQFEMPYMKALKSFLMAEKKQGKTIFPQGFEYFLAMDLTPFNEIKVVILGQDPYHGPGQAHGLSFSVRENVAIPPSLKNIYKALFLDLDIKPASHGNLESWAKQGVLLLNSVLTVERHKAGSHQGKGWEQFTDQIIKQLNAERDGIVFILWGAYAQKKGSFIDRNRHLVLSSVHPSPLSAHRGFFDSRPFSKTNNYLIQQGKEPVHWQLE